MTKAPSAKAPAQAAKAALSPRNQKIVVRDLTLSSSIGITAQERARPQRIRVNLEIEVAAARPATDRIAEVVNYSHLVGQVREVCANTDAQLLETLAAEVAGACCRDERVRAITVRIEKLDRYADVGGVGVEVSYGRGP